MKYLIALALLLNPLMSMAGMDDDFPAPFDFSEELDKEAAADAAEAAEQIPTEAPILLPKEPIRKMASKPLVVRPAPTAIKSAAKPDRIAAKTGPTAAKPNSRAILNKAKSENLKKKQAQALKKLGGQKKAAK